MAKKSEQQETSSASLIAGSDVVFDYICQSCNEDGKHLEAVGFCADCSEFLCDECFRYHPKPKLTRHHKLLDIEAAKKDTNLSAYLDICTEKCTQHNGKTVEYFCLDHDCLGCGVCLNLDHRNCKGVQYIPNIAKDVGNGDELSTLIKELDNLLCQTKELADTSLNNKLKSQDIFDKALDHVKQVKREVNEALNKLENEIEKRAEKMKKNDMLRMEENIQSCEEMQTKVQNISTYTKAMQNKQQYCNLFVAMKTAQSEMRAIAKSLEDSWKDNAISDYLFQPSEQLEHFLKRSGSLGKLSKKQIKTKAAKVLEIDLKMDSDSQTCRIAGMVMLTSLRLAATDHYNKKVKLIDIKQSKVISEYQVQCEPYDITTTGETDEVAVTQYSNNEIALLRVRGDRLYENKKIKTTGRCFGIACIKDKFVISLTGPERLEIIDTQGNVLQTIEKDGSGKQLFSDIYSIAVNQDTGTIYVPDYIKGVIMLSLSGHVLGIYEDSDLEKARYVTVDKGGVVYVCGEDSHNIHQVTPECNKIRILLKKQDGLDYPETLCYNEYTDCLYVGYLNNKVLVYQLIG